MSIGPVQLIVLGFDHPDFRGEIVGELERLRENDAVRVAQTATVVRGADDRPAGGLVIVDPIG
jgi:hypothetical protein